MAVNVKRPFFTVITVCFNAGNGVRRTIEALREQTCGDYEHIIKDGGSTDGSAEAILSFTQSDQRIKAVIRPDNGIYDAMNQALAEARGQYIYFLNCGDTFSDSNVLTDVKRFIETTMLDNAVIPDKANKNADIDGEIPNSSEASDDAVIYGDFILRGEMLRQPKRINGFYLYRRPLNHQSAFFGSGVFARHGTFDTSFSVRADHELTLRAFKGNSTFLKIDRVIAVYEGGGFSERPDKKELRTAELEVIRSRYFTMEERKKYGLRIRLSLVGLRSRLRSVNSPKWLRAAYRKIANFFNR